MSLLGFASWMEPLVTAYCTRWDLKYWQNPHTCNPQYLSSDQIQFLKHSRRDSKFIKRACELDIVTECIWRKEKQERLIRICVSRPFKPNIMNHVLVTILQQPTTTWRDSNVLLWFNTNNICDFEAYKWFQAKDLIPSTFSIWKHAIDIDDVRLYQLAQHELENDVNVPHVIYSVESIRNLIEKRCFRILEWVLDQPHAEVSDLFVELLHYRPTLRIVQTFPKQKVRFQETCALSYECVQYLLDAKILDCSVQYLCEYYKGYPHEDTALQFLVAHHQTLKIQCLDYEWSLERTDIKQMKLIQKLNPKLFQSQITSMWRYRETKFWLRHGGICDLEDLLQQHRYSPFHLKKLYKLFDSHPTQITSEFRFRNSTETYKNTNCAQWIVQNIIKNKSHNHFTRACEICSPFSLKLLFHAIAPSLELLNNVKDEHVMIAWIHYCGLERIVEYVNSDRCYHLYPIIARAILLEPPNWDLVKRLVAKDLDVVYKLKLYLLWPDAFEICAHEHFIVEKLFHLKNV